MIKKLFSAEFLKSMEAKGISTKQLLQEICSAIENKAWSSENVSDSKTIKYCEFSLCFKMENFPVDEKNLARITGLSRATLADWRKKGFLSDYRQEDRLRFYRRLDALKKISEQLLDSPRSELLDSEIFADIF